MKDELQFLKEVKEYIEGTEVDNDGEWGSGRTLEELIEQKEMPELYQKVLELIKISKEV